MGEWNLHPRLSQCLPNRYADLSQVGKLNPLVRKRLNSPQKDMVAVVESSEDAHSSTTALHVPSTESPSRASVAADGGPPDDRDTGNSVADLGKPVNARRIGSRRVAAAKKKLNTDPDMPSFKAAMAGSDRELWHIACHEEVVALRDHGTFTLVPRPVGHPVISAKFVLKIKRLADGSIERRKARYVARGFTQVEGIDFFETYSPVGSYATLRVLLAIAAYYDLEIKHIDIQCAFLNGKLKEEVYVEQPPLFGDGTSCLEAAQGSVWTETGCT